MKTLGILFLLFSLSVSASVDIEKFKWGDIDVVYIEDQRLPTFFVQVLFYDGALSDAKDKVGATDFMFDLLKKGTTKFNQKEIAEKLDTFGSELGNLSVHEYSSLVYSGLAKEVGNTSSLVCHLFSEASFPKEEIERAKIVKTNNLKNLALDHSSTAERVFRGISMHGTPFEDAVDGRLETIKNIKSEDLKNKLNYFNQDVAKKIYVTGPKVILKDLERIIKNECPWSHPQKNLFKREITNSSMSQKQNSKFAPGIYFVKVPKANQAQIRIGRYIHLDEIKNKKYNSIEKTGLVSEFLGGGFTSKLVQELRVKRGLTYTAGAVIAFQKYYGRVVLSTFTKNETVKESLTVIKDVLDKTGRGEISASEINGIKDNLIGSHPFKFEATKAFIQNLAFYDHINKSYEDIYNYPQLISQIEKIDIEEYVRYFYNWNEQIILVLGDASLEKQLKDFGNVTTVKYQDFL
jgi:zinc protease